MVKNNYLDRKDYIPFFEQQTWGWGLPRQERGGRPTRPSCAPFPTWNPKHFLGILFLESTSWSFCPWQILPRVVPKAWNLKSKFWLKVPDPAVVGNIKVAHPHFCRPYAKMGAATFSMSDGYSEIVTILDCNRNKCLLSKSYWIYNNFLYKSVNLYWSPVSMEDLELIEFWRVNGKCKKHHWKYNGCQVASTIKRCKSAKLLWHHSVSNFRGS